MTHDNEAKALRDALTNSRERSAALKRARRIKVIVTGEEGGEFLATDLEAKAPGFDFFRARLLEDEKARASRLEAALKALGEWCGAEVAPAPAAAQDPRSAAERSAEAMPYDAAPPVEDLPPLTSFYSR